MSEQPWYNQRTTQLVYDHPEPERNFPYKYSEEEILREVENYVRSTYQQHYAGSNGVQLMDLFFAEPDEAIVFCKTNAMKYLSRFGKKDGSNRKDLLKAMHYMMLLMHCDNIRGK